MEHERFIARRRARFDGIDGKVNIPYGTALTCQDGFLMHKNQRVCAVGSQNGMDCFVQDDDGNGTLRRTTTALVTCGGSWLTASSGALSAGMQPTRPAGIRSGRRHSAKSTAARSPKTTGCGRERFLMLRFLICRQSPRWFSEGDGCESERIVLERWRDGFGAALAH